MRRVLVALLGAGCLVVLGGCLVIAAPKEVRVVGHARPETCRAVEKMSECEAKAELAWSRDEIRRLRKEVSEGEQDRRRLQAELREIESKLAEVGGSERSSKRDE